MTAVRIAHVTKTFGDRKVLDDVTLDIPSGTAFCLLGRSGTGKSVTLKHIIGLMKPDRGRVLVHGRDVVALEGRELAEVRRSMGFLFQIGLVVGLMALVAGGFTWVEHLVKKSGVQELVISQCQADTKMPSRRCSRILVAAHLFLPTITEIACVVAE